MNAPLNLASRPLRNEALPALAFAMAALLLAGATAAHALTLKRLLSGSTSALHRDVAALDAEHASLRQRIADLRPLRTDPKTVLQWAFLKDLVDRRVFSWTDLFSRLEELQPPGVRLTAIQPNVKKGEVRVDVSAIARTMEQGLSFVKTLEESPDFSEVYPTAVDRRSGDERQEGIEFHYVMRYEPQPRKARSKGDAPPAAEGEEPEQAPADDQADQGDQPAGDEQP